MIKFTAINLLQILIIWWNMHLMINKKNQKEFEQSVPPPLLKSNSSSILLTTSIYTKRPTCLLHWIWPLLYTSVKSGQFACRQIPQKLSAACIQNLPIQLEQAKPWIHKRMIIRSRYDHTACKIANAQTPIRKPTNNQLHCC